MNKEEIDNRIGQYLKSIDVRTMEFFEEMYDHISTSFENRVNKDQDINQHIQEQVQPAFGGVKGIQSIQKKQQGFRSKMIMKRFLAIAKDYLISWPYAAYTLLITLLIIQANQVFQPKHVLLYTMAGGVIVAIGLSGFDSIKFYLKCRKQNKYYRQSDVNLRLLGLATLGTSSVNLFLNLFGLLFFGSQDAAMEFYLNYPVLQVAMSTVFTLYALVYIKIHKERFVYKISI